MRLFDSRGMMIFPNPMSKEKICKSEQILVVKDCYCQNGHSLINDCAVFNGFPGIVFKIRRDNNEGLLLLVRYMAIADFFNCIVVCNRIDCFNAAINHGNEMITLSMIDRL